MKININKVKIIPKEISEKFGFCIYGELPYDVKEWIKHHEMKVETLDKYSNIYTEKKMQDLFIQKPKYEYLDGFSPNLNKHLHIGHLSNLILAKAFSSLNIANNKIAILGDTLEGEVGKEEALESYKKLTSKFGYFGMNILFASEMKYDDDLLLDGIDKYVGTKIFDVGGTKVVGIKADGTTSYFYQDAALAKTLNASTLYLTGNEQIGHFKILKKMFPLIDHVGLGLVKAKGKKMSSRVGNVIMADDVISMLEENFTDFKVAYNVLSGFILKSAPKSDKNIDMDQLTNLLNSPGLYLSYTLAKLKSAGVDVSLTKEFKSQHLQFKHLKALDSLSPNVLFDEVIEHAKQISTLYAAHKIKDNADNKKMFESLASDLLLGMTLLGLFDVDKV